jgi:hypothetical protein
MPEQANSWEISNEHSYICSMSDSGIKTCPSEMFCGHPQQHNITAEDDGLLEEFQI